jgi:hypothetical protein
VVILDFAHEFNLPNILDSRVTLEHNGIIGLVVEYIVAIDVTRVRFPDDAFCPN